MLNMQRAALTALIAFFPIFGLLWLGAPWSSSKADFELTGTTLSSETRAHFSALDSARSSTAGSSSWLKSEAAARAVLDSLPHNRAVALAEVGETWGVKLRERMRAIVCYQPLEAWRVGDRNACTLLGDWLKPQTHVDQLEVIKERLSIHHLVDGRHIEISFRAADPNLATVIVDAFGDALLQRQSVAMRDLRRRIVEHIEAEIAELTRREAALEMLPIGDATIVENGKEDLDFALLGKFTAALTNARNELPAQDRHQLDGDLGAVKAAVRDQLMSNAADRRGASLTTERLDEDSAAVPTGSLMLLGHPDWSKPAVIPLSETATDGFSLSKIAMIAFVLSVLTGLAASAIWPLLRYRSDDRHDFYASPYANPHWPNVRVMEPTEPDKAV